MERDVRGDLYHGVFRWHRHGGIPRLTRHEAAPPAIPDPDTGNHLAIATVEAGGTAICPSCASRGQGGFVSFVADLRLAYACPHCERLVWVAGA